jgi:hypothetical protein
MLPSIKNGYALLARIMEQNPSTSLAGLACRGADRHCGSDLGTRRETAMATNSTSRHWRNGTCMHFHNSRRVGNPFELRNENAISQRHFSERLASRNSGLLRRFSGAGLFQCHGHKNGCCRQFAVYQYDGPSDLQDTTIVWLDDTHLRIEYRADVDHYQHCTSQVADVTIICAPLAAGKN